MKYFKYNEKYDSIKEECYLANILCYERNSTINNRYSNYPYEYKIGNWILRRTHNYWIATTEQGLSLKDALILYEKRNPIITTDILGKIIRADGSGGSPILTAQPIYNNELEEQLISLGYKKEYSEFLYKEYIPITRGKVAELCNDGKLYVERYVNLYHIDNQIGLNEFVKFIQNNNKNI